VKPGAVTRSPAISSKRKFYSMVLLGLVDDVKDKTVRSAVSSTPASRRRGCIGALQVQSTKSYTTFCSLLYVLPSAIKSFLTTTRGQLHLIKATGLLVLRVPA